MTVHDQHVLPHGGQKASGWGRFNGKGAVEAFTQTKNITLGDSHGLPLHLLS
jgi:acyl-CoA reductase-like NAD-dependent aldehyde dehydrogenase